MPAPLSLQALTEAAAGKRPAELVLKNGNLVNLFTDSLERADLALEQGFIAGIGSYKGKREINLNGLFVCPGFMDGHMHVESTMLSPAELARAVCPHGTSTVFADPHEIANVMGSRGVEAMIMAARGLPVEFLFEAPSCVPATHLETSGAELTAGDLARLRRFPEIIGLAEMMNFPGVLNTDQGVMDKLAAFGDMPIDGHAPFLSGADLNAYCAAGPASDHECSTIEEAREKLARGMWIMLRQGTGAKNLLDLLPLVTPRTERRCLMVTDDRHPDELAHEGHMDALLRLAVSHGLDPMTALSMVSFNTARRFGLKRRGALAPGYQADLALVHDLSGFKVEMVFKKGRMVANSGEALEFKSPAFDDAARQTVNIGNLQKESFTPLVKGNRARALELTPGQLLTRELIVPAPQARGRLTAAPEQDLALLAVVERHQASGRVGNGLIKGLGLKKGALAGSVAHDSHNLIVAGADAKSMLTAAQRVAQMQGGLVVALGDKVLAELPLSLAGLMSDQPLASVLEAIAALRLSARQITDLEEPFMLLSFVALPVIPDLRITDQGLVDVNAFNRVELFCN
ncbi:adenine deaminase [Dethiosulfatarculus sandiegensis]|uniref:adenine deaminase n=1 Tax=Dethiosulfatarculus sandiegensis TaxID=1429043 RepID=UPI0005C8ADC5|nr:adenine deaminase [Dethiosulfatarculus sandiegensis]